MTTLLSKTSSRILACTVAVLAAAAPLFYFITRNFYAEDMADIIESVKSGHGLPELDLERDIMTGMALQYAVVIAIVTVSLYITVRLVTRRLWQPFDDTLRKTEQFNIEQGQLPHFAQTDVTEFDRLNRSLTKLMEKDRQAFLITKELAENASHELQTPLAVMKGKLDLLIQENLNERQMQMVADLYTMTTRLTHLNRNLLLLARIDNGQFTDREDVDIAAAVADETAHYDAIKGNSTIIVSDERTDHRRTVQANAALTECLLRNLIVNAVRHSPDGAEVRVTVSDNTLTVDNRSDGAPLDKTTLFRRFSTAGQRKGGNGLGLAIVKAVCDYHHWTIDYDFSNAHHKFTVTFA